MELNELVTIAKTLGYGDVDCEQNLFPQLNLDKRIYGNHTSFGYKEGIVFTIKTNETGIENVIVYPPYKETDKVKELNAC